LSVDGAIGNPDTTRWKHIWSDPEDSIGETIGQWLEEKVKWALLDHQIDIDR
jgi:hypothetical protein